MKIVRLLIAAMVLALALPVAAQAPAKPGAKPSNLQPIPEPPPPPPGYELDPALEPQVTILRRGADTVEEYRVAGKLYMIKVTPPHGVPYYMIDRQGDGKFVREDTLGSNIRPPMWVIFTF
jgi:uncharacterized protein DUF2782